MKKSITKITSILTAAMLAVTPAFQYAPAFYAAESESTEELTDAVKQEVDTILAEISPVQLLKAGD